ncbi:hypothetical protein ASD89_02580 [Caulobacter sp. Root656]|nr:hypothetical protein ASD89_02580 [Caulobacter sp. Root656]
MKLIASLTGLALVLGSGTAARAQGFPDLGYMGTTIGAGGLQTSAMNNVISMSVQSRSAPARGPAYATAARGALGLRPRDAGVTTYRADPQVAARVQKQFSDWMAKQAGPDAGRQVAAAMQRTNPVRNWSQLVASDGLRAGDTADALAGYWVLNWMIANGGDNTRAQTLAVRDQVRPIIANNPAYGRLDEPHRQEFAEILMLNFLIQHAAYVDAMKRGDQPTLRKLADAAVARFRNEMGVDLRQLRLTDQGMIKG